MKGPFEGKIFLVHLRRIIVILMGGMLSLALLCYSQFPSLINDPLSRIKWLRLENIDIQVSWPLSKDIVAGWVSHLNGRCLLTLDGTSLVSYLQGKPWVNTVVIKKTYPRSLQIFIEPKHPAAVYVVRGAPHFLDSEGNLVEKVTAPLLRAVSLPVITAENLASTPFQWDMKRVVDFLDRFEKYFGKRAPISEVLLETFPYMKVFLIRPKVELQVSLETGMDQWSILDTLLTNPPSQIGQPRKINLVFPKKAIVRSSLSN